MTWVNSDFTLGDAAQQGFDTWDLYVTEWGNFQAGSPPLTNISFPGAGSKALPTVSGLAIGPQSEVDRCFVGYDLAKVLTTKTGWDAARRLSVGSPLMYPQNGTTRTIANPAYPQANAATLVVYPWASSSAVASLNGEMPPTVFQATYRGTDGSTKPLTYFINSSDRVAPSSLLHLVFYLKPPAHGAPTKRAPWRRGFPVIGALPADVEAPIAMAPSFGRKSARVVMYCSTQGFSYRITGILAGGSSYEFPLAASTSEVAEDSTVSVLIDNLCGADFLVVNVTPVGGTGLFNARVHLED